MKDSKNMSSVLFVVVAVVVLAVYTLTKQDKEVEAPNMAVSQEEFATSPEETDLQVNENLNQQVLSQVSGGDTTEAQTTGTVNGTTTVTTTENTNVSEEEVKSLRFCSPKVVQDCKVCLTKNCIPENNNSVVSCYTKSENCLSDLPQRRLSMTEIKHFDKIMANSYK